MAFWRRDKSKRRLRKEKDTGQTTQPEQTLAVEERSGNGLNSGKMAETAADSAGQESVSGSLGKQKPAADSAGRGIKQESLELEQMSSINRQDRKRFVRETCEAVAENDRQIADAKKEYEQVTEYLSDIQRVDRATEEVRGKLHELCRRIIRLTEERRKYKNRKLTITETQIRRFEPYEDDLVAEIRKMYEAEAYQKAVEGDIDNLNQEKKNIYQEQREIVENQNALKGMARVMMFLILSLFVLFVVIYYTLEVDMTFPYLATVLLAAISSTVLFVESNRNRQRMVLAERKLSKAISLLNRVKIKYVNNVNLLDYNREKFGVRSALEFEKQWSEFCKLKEYERRFRENTFQLNSDNESLLEMMKELGVVHREIWLGRAAAIVDSREMVEVRHELNQRRQKLRERIDYNENTKQSLVAQIDKLLTEHPEEQDELLAEVQAHLPSGADE